MIFIKALENSAKWFDRALRGNIHYFSNLIPLIYKNLFVLSSFILLIYILYISFGTTVSIVAIIAVSIFLIFGSRNPVPDNGDILSYEAKVFTIIVDLIILLFILNHHFGLYKFINKSSFNQKTNYVKEIEQANKEVILKQKPKESTREKPAVQEPQVVVSVPPTPPPVQPPAKKTLRDSVSKDNVQTFADPFAYCRAVGTNDYQGTDQYKGYAGPEVPREVSRAFQNNDIVGWRCVNGEVYGCELGASGSACFKKDTSTVPTMAMREFCREKPNFDFIPMSHAGDSFASWSCKGTTPVIDHTFPVLELDERGYIKSSWRKVSR